MTLFKPGGGGPKNVKKMVFCDFKKTDASDEKSSIHVGGAPIGLSEKIKSFDIFESLGFDLGFETFSF